VPYLSASAVVFHYEETLYQVYGPLPLPYYYYTKEQMWQPRWGDNKQKMRHTVGRNDLRRDEVVDAMQLAADATSLHNLFTRLALRRAVVLVRALAQCRVAVDAHGVPTPRTRPVHVEHSRVAAVTHFTDTLDRSFPCHAFCEQHQYGE